MLNDLLRALLEKQTPAPEREATVATQDDRFEQAAPYRRWPLGFRTALRLRYLALKKRILLQFRQDLEYDVSAADVQAGVLGQLRQQTRQSSVWTFTLGRAVLYLTLLVLLCALALGIHLSIEHAREQAVFKHLLPEYSDKVYQLKAQLARQQQSAETSAETTAESSAEDRQSPRSADDRVTRLQQQIGALRNRLAGHFSGLPAIQQALLAVLDGVAQRATSGKEMIRRTKLFNDLLYERGIAYYISPVSQSAYCADLPAERFLGRLFAGEQSTGEMCEVHALTAFDVEQSRYYAERSDKHLALFTRRLDLMELQDSYLGLVHIGDDRAQIRLSNISNASADSLLAVSDGVLRSKLMPRGMPDVYGLESLARRLQSRVINAYIADFERRWWQRIPSLWQELMGRSPDLLALAGERLQRRIVDVTAFHEVQHLVDQAADIQEPAWFAQAIQPFGKRVQGEIMRRHIFWELSAFFTHMAYAEELQGILLNDFTAITLNPMLQDQPHFYSIRILLAVLHQQLKGELGSEVQPAITLADVARAYKALAAHSDELDSLVRDTYQVLFDKPLTVLHETRVPPRSVSRFGSDPNL